MKETFGSTIRRIRKLRKIKGKDLAKQIGRSYFQLAHVESGKTAPSVEMVKRLASSLQLDETELRAKAASVKGIKLRKLPEDDQHDLLRFYELCLNLDISVAEASRIVRRAKVFGGISDAI